MFPVCTILRVCLQYCVLLIIMNAKAVLRISAMNTVDEFVTEACQQRLDNWRPSENCSPGDCCFVMANIEHPSVNLLLGFDVIVYRISVYACILNSVNFEIIIAIADS